MNRLDSLRNGPLGTILFYSYLLAVVIGGIVIGQVVLRNQAAIQAAHRALCAIKASDERRLESALQRLIDHPEGTPDFPRGVVIRSIKVSRSDLAGLGDVNCPTVKETP